MNKDFEARHRRHPIGVYVRQYLFTNMNFTPSSSGTWVPAMQIRYSSSPKYHIEMLALNLF